MGDGLEQVECVTRDGAHSESHFNTGTQRWRQIMTNAIKRGYVYIRDPLDSTLPLDY
jgi:hypothetical protein